MVLTLNFNFETDEKETGARSFEDAKSVLAGPSTSKKTPKLVMIVDEPSQPHQKKARGNAKMVISGLATLASAPLVLERGRKSPKLSQR